MKDLLDALDEGVDDTGVVAEVGRLDELDIGMPRRDAIGRLVDPVDEDAGEKEVGKHDDPTIREPGGMFENRLDDGKRDARVSGYRPPEA